LADLFGDLIFSACIDQYHVGALLADHDRRRIRVA
jgi:hypothetical protein